jgi:hypothetical protein
VLTCHGWDSIACSSQPQLSMHWYLLLGSQRHGGYTVMTLETNQYSPNISPAQTAM